MEEALELFNSFFDMMMSKSSQNKITQKILYEIKDYIVKAVKELYRGSRSKSHFSQDEEGKIEICLNNLNEIIDIFNEDDESRAEFVKGFNKWKKYRVESIDRLDKIAQTMHKDKKVTDALKLIFGVVGIGAGACVLASIFFPPAGVAVLPAWLSGSAIAPYLPSFFRRTVVPATSALAIRGGIASSIGGVSGLCTALAELGMLKKRIDEAKDVIETDKEYFQFAMKWFTHTEHFKEAMESVLNMSIIKIVTRDILDFADKIRKSQDKQAPVRIFFEQLRRKINIDQVLPPHLTMIVIAVLLMIFLVSRKNLLLLGCFAATLNIVLAPGALNAGLTAVQSATILTTKGAMAGVKRAPQLLLRDTTLGLIAGVGLALNAATVVLSTIDLSKGSVSEQGKEIEKISDSLKEQLEMVEEIYEELQKSIIKDLVRTSQENARARLRFH